jgi:hypothetical protein
MEDEERGSGCVRGAIRRLNKAEKSLDKWEKKDPAKLAVEDAGDVTTEEEESDCYYNSDYSN